MKWSSLYAIVRNIGNYNACFVIKVSTVVSTTASSEYTSQQTLPTTTNDIAITILTIPTMGPTIDHDGEYLNVQYSDMWYNNYVLRKSSRIT